jgi:methionyl-tRNA synthetase
MTLDEFEAVRLADHEALYQEQAAEKMNVSRQTFGRIIDSAHRKIAEALVEGKSLRIEGGDIQMSETRTFKCHDCQHVWQLAFGTGRPTECPACKSRNLHRDAEERGAGRGGHGRRGFGCRRSNGRD